MFGLCGRWVCAAAVLALCWSVPASAQPVSFTGSYTQNFDSMGTSGTTPPAGWTLLNITGASGDWTNTSGSNSVPPSPGIPGGAAIAGGTPGTGLTAQLIDASNPAANNGSQGFNAATGANPNDRTLVTSPTGVAGSVLELQLVNNTGVGRTGLTISYDIRRMQAGADSARTPPPGIPEGSDEIPGFWLFYSLDNGATFTNVPALTPVGAGPSSQPIVPNTVGVTNVPATQFTFSGTWAPGANLVLRWVDDNAI